MSRINNNNYEAFWLDYLEGQLSPEDTAEFLLFVSQHPELDIDLDEELVALQDDTVTSLTEEEKTAIKEYAKMESLVVLELDDEGAVDQNLVNRHPEHYQHLVRDYKQTLLVVPEVQYPGKRDLKKALVIPMYLRVAAAASVVGIITFLFPWNSTNNPAPIADETTTTTSAPMLQVSSILSPNSKSFNFTQEGNELFTSDDLPDENDFIANEKTPTPVDTTKVPDPIIPLDGNPIAEDTTGASEEFMPMDDIVHELDTNNASLPEIDEDMNEVALNPASKKLTVPEFLAEKVLNVEKKEEEPLVATILDEKTNWDVDYQEEESDNKKVTQFKLGKFEFYKSSKVSAKK